MVQFRLKNILLQSSTLHQNKVKPLVRLASLTKSHNNLKLRRKKFTIHFSQIMQVKQLYNTTKFNPKKSKLTIDFRPQLIVMAGFTRNEEMRK
jgi:hypothetical protein